MTEGGGGEGWGANCLRPSAGTLPGCQEFLENLLVERGEDQLVEVDEATEANSELHHLPADRGQTSRERGGVLVLTGL